VGVLNDLLPGRRKKEKEKREGSMIQVLKGTGRQYVPILATDRGSVHRRKL